VRGGGDLVQLKRCWDRHNAPLPGYEARSRVLRDEVAAILPSFSMQDPLAQTSYLSLLDTGQQLQPRTPPPPPPLRPPFYGSIRESRTLGQIAATMILWTHPPPTHYACKSSF